MVEDVRPGVRRILCNNPSPFTFTGTVSYIVGHGKVAIIDPGPDDEAHAKALLDAVRGEIVTHILVDAHASRPLGEYAAHQLPTGAPVYAEGPHRASRPRFESEREVVEPPAPTASFGPISRSGTATSSRARDGSSMTVATPGHTVNHLAFAVRER